MYLIACQTQVCVYVHRPQLSYRHRHADIHISNRNQIDTHTPNNNIKKKGQQNVRLCRFGPDSVGSFSYLRSPTTIIGAYDQNIKREKISSE